MRTSLFILPILLTTVAIFSSQKIVGSQERGLVRTLNYSWAGKRMDGQFWGFRMSDLDGDGIVEAILLERQRILIGRLNEAGFEEQTSCTWKGEAKAARMYLLDLDGDGDQEVIVSAVEGGMPSSLALDYKNGGCTPLFERARWYLRVIDYVPASLSSIEPAFGTDANDKCRCKASRTQESGNVDVQKRKSAETQEHKLLVGQTWSSSDYFSGPIYVLVYEEGKLSAVKKYNLPKMTEIYQFTPLPGRKDSEEVLLLKGVERLEVHERRGEKFNRVWKGGMRLGGSLNYLPASQREVLGIETSDIVVFDLPPIVEQEASCTAGEGSRVSGVPCYSVIAVKHDMPLKGFLGRRPYIRDAKIVGFRPDPALTLMEEFMTAPLPGAVVDYFIDNTCENGAKKLLILVQLDPGFFHQGTQSMILSFDIPGIIESSEK